MFFHCFFHLNFDRKKLNQNKARKNKAKTNISNLMRTSSRNHNRYRNRSINTEYAVPSSSLSQQNQKINEQNHHKEQIYTEENEELVTINGVTGVIVNKDEIENWRRQYPLSEDPINDTSLFATNHQNVFIRYLQPPTPLPHEYIEQEDEVNI